MREATTNGSYKTAIDDLLPVSLEDRQQSKKTATAFSIVLDRSGSMAVTTPGGQTKMDLANNAAAECIRLMNGVDSVSVIAVDSAAHIIVPQTAVENPESIIARCLSIQSMGGGIFVYTGLVAAGSQILGAQQLNKHVLLFADAADAEEPGQYRQLLGYGLVKDGRFQLLPDLLEDRRLRGPEFLYLEYTEPVAGGQWFGVLAGFKGEEFLFSLRQQHAP